MWNCKIYRYLTNLKIYINTINKVIWQIAEHITVNYLLLINQIFSPVHSSIYNNPINSKFSKYNDKVTFSYKNYYFNCIFEMIT